MWKQVARADWPDWSDWAKTLNSVWIHPSGFLLTSKTNQYSTLWSLWSPAGKEVTNQMDLPFKEGLDGAPISWANEELTRRRVA